ncbi:MAG: hypothetical protein HRT69_09040 [Flavobacteriaceae bacterium]|nr:hypothetical protein [Flavobacteriaceae bacterium]
MKNIALLLVLILSACKVNTPTVGKESIEGVESIAAVKMIQVELVDLMKEINHKDSKVRKFAHKKYVGKRLLITGRVNDVSAKGTVRLQVEPYADSITCYGLMGNMLTTLNKGDVVKVYGTFYIANPDMNFTKQFQMFDCRLLLS